MDLVLIFPHQLFEHHPAFEKDRKVVFVEAPLFFSAFSFHRQKLAFHRASMKGFQEVLKRRGYQTLYVEGELSGVLNKEKPSCVHVMELDDHKLDQDLKSLAQKLGLKLVFHPHLGFMTSLSTFQSLFKHQKKLRFDSFYIHLRKTHELLLDKNGKPLGGKWSLDRENRKKIPKSLKIAKPFKVAKTKRVAEAFSYVKKNFPSNPGALSSLSYPTTHTEAKKALQYFLKHHLKCFGDYEDAIVQKEKVLFHSCLSAPLNVGLLTPQQIIEEALKYCQKHKVGLNNLEGFVRQVAGWREFIRGVYHLIGKKEEKKNFFRHLRKMPKAFYEGSSGILPLDETIKKVEQNAYAHHIERLMVLGNFFLLCEIDPKEVYRWFMELFIDAYDWVMVPNVYGMSQYADGGMITTKPYLSSSNYILKMSDYPKGGWCKVWDALFWRFMIKHLKFFSSQPRLSVLCATAKKKKQDKALLKVAEDFLKKLR